MEVAGMGEHGCGQCRHYIELQEPYRYDKAGYLDGVTVYGFCAKAVIARGVFFPVYIPDAGACKDFKRLPRAPREHAACAEQIRLGGVDNAAEPGERR